jgi:hypothetical protein
MCYQIYTFKWDIEKRLEEHLQKEEGGIKWTKRTNGINSIIRIKIVDGKDMLDTCWDIEKGNIRDKCEEHERDI